MLNATTKVVRVTTITDVTSLSIAEIHYLIGMGWYEYLNNPVHNDEYMNRTMMKELHWESYHHYTISTNPIDRSLVFTCGKNCGTTYRVEILPSLNGDGIDVLFKTDTEKILYFAHWTIEELVNNDFIVEED